MTLSLNNLAALYDSQGRYTEAEPLYLQALAIAEQALGENHPNTIIWLFGNCYAMDGGYKGWNPYIERHLAIFVNYF